LVNPVLLMTKTVPLTQTDPERIALAELAWARAKGMVEARFRHLRFELGERVTSKEGLEERALWLSLGNVSWIEKDVKGNKVVVKLAR
jgi:hypothetical protein